MVKKPKGKQQESKGNNRKLLQEPKGYFDTPNDQIKAKYSLKSMIYLRRKVRIFKNDIRNMTAADLGLCLVVLLAFFTIGKLCVVGVNIVVIA